MQASIEVKQMWAGGPLRRFATSQLNPRWKPYESETLKGYVSNYVCAECRKDVLGVHGTSDGWLCAECRRNHKSTPETSKNHATCKRGGVC